MESIERGAMRGRGGCQHYVIVPAGGAFPRGEYVVLPLMHEKKGRTALLCSLDERSQLYVMPDSEITSLCAEHAAELGYERYEGGGKSKGGHH